MDNDEEIYSNIQESFSTIVINKVKKSPLSTIGLTAFFTVAAIGAYKYKNRGSTQTSLYLIHLRLMGQGAVMGILGIGVIYSIVQDYFPEKKVS